MLALQFLCVVNCRGTLSTGPSYAEAVKTDLAPPSQYDTATANDNALTAPEPGYYSADSASDTYGLLIASQNQATWPSYEDTDSSVYEQYCYHDYHDPDISYPASNTYVQYEIEPSSHDPDISAASAQLK